MRSLAIVAALAVPAAAAPDPTTPTSELLLCVRPAKSTQLPPVLDGAPRAAVTRRVKSKQKIELLGVRMVITSRLIPERVGSKHGEVVASLHAEIASEVDRDGETAENSLDERIGIAPARLGGYRITATPAGSEFEITVEDLGCREAAQERPLAKGRSQLAWVSTGATHSYALRDGAWHEVAAEESLQLELRSGLIAGNTDPKDPQLGYVALTVSDRVNAVPESIDLSPRQLRPGFKLARRQYRIEVVRIVYGANTILVDGWPHTTGKAPQASVLVRITRTR
jgi:hypothetical protein